MGEFINDVTCKVVRKSLCYRNFILSPTVFVCVAAAAGDDGMEL